MATKTFVFCLEDTEFTVKFPIKKEVCSRCDGEGKHVNPSIDGHGISSEEFAEDPEFEEAYFSGRYDVQCEECEGLRVVDEIDEEACKRDPELADYLAKYHLHLDERYRHEQEWAAERRWGA